MSKQWNESTATAKGLYDPRYEHDNCGIGAVVNIKGIKTHETVENALKIVENLKHRAGKDADGKTGDGVGILLQISHKFFKKVTKPLGIELGDERDYGVGMFFFPNDEFKTIQAKKMLREDLSLTESCMLQDVFSSSQTTILMWFPSQAEQSYIRECSL